MGGGPSRLDVPKQHHQSPLLCQHQSCLAIFSTAVRQLPFRTHANAGKSSLQSVPVRKEGNAISREGNRGLKPHPDAEAGGLNPVKRASFTDFILIAGPKFFRIIAKLLYAGGKQVVDGDQELLTCGILQQLYRQHLPWFPPNMSERGQQNTEAPGMHRKHLSGTFQR